MWLTVNNLNMLMMCILCYMSNYLNNWLIQAFRCATITKDDNLEMEVLFINMEKQKIYNAKLLLA